MGLLAKVDPKDLKSPNSSKESPVVSPDPIERREEYIRVVSKMTSEQRAFLSAYIHHGTMSRACEIVGISQNTPRKWESEGVEWRYAYSLATADTLMAAQQTMEQAAVKAVQTLIDLMDSADQKIKLQAADKLTKLLESSKVKKVQHEHSGDIGVQVDYKATLMRLVQGEAEALGSEEDVVESTIREIPDSIEDS